MGLVDGIKNRAKTAGGGCTARKKRSTKQAVYPNTAREYWSFCRSSAPQPVVLIGAGVLAE